jgi:phi13 family phage major tail protein
MTYVAKPIGARKLTWWPVAANTDTDLVAASYEAAVRLSRLINIQVTPVFAEGVLESDDGIEDNQSLIVAYDVTINASQLTDAIRAALLGHAMDAGGGILTAGGDVAQEGALAWEEELSNNVAGGTTKYKKVVLYKGKFKEFVETANTITEGGITYQTHNLVGRFFRRVFDKNLKYSIREDSPSADAVKLAAWFTTPQEYGNSLGTTVVIPVADPVAGAVTANSTVALTTATPAAEIRYTLNGTTPGLSSTLYDGPILIDVAKTIKAIAFKVGMNPSPMLTAAYTITP